MSNIVPFVFKGHNITVLSDDDGSLHFVAIEVAEVLGYSDAYEMTKRLDEDEKSNRQIAGFGSPTGGRGVTVISESGLYDAILGSTKPEAKPFQKWVRSEVLPSIRKTGNYSLTQKSPAELSRMDILQIAMDAEQGRLVAEAERDEAIRTKAQIGNKREATAMATASAAAREAAKLRDTLGFSARHATIIAVENQTCRKFGKQGYQPLRKYCKTNGLRPEKVHDPRWGVATAWPAVAWEAVYGIDLCELFPEAALEAA